MAKTVGHKRKASQSTKGHAAERAGRKQPRVADSSRKIVSIEHPSHSKVRSVEEVTTALFCCDVF